MIFVFRVKIIGIGNGKGCRDIELWLCNLIELRVFQPVDVKYCIVNEAGISTYSVTKQAKEELPNLPPLLRSAVAIARRLQDPLLEYSKVEPKHLGVGTYQHDLPEDQLRDALNAVVEECASFVGIDLNVCSLHILSKISGLNEDLAENIIDYRNEHGPFVNRRQLLQVDGITQKVFQQCAGFVKILPETSTPVYAGNERKRRRMSSSNSFNPLDMTIIHPEDYETAEKFLKEIKSSPQEIGTATLVTKVTNYMAFRCTEEVATLLGTTVPMMQLIIDALKQAKNSDIRGELDPLFCAHVRSFSEVVTDQVLFGLVRSVSSFGAFVDIGTDKEGLIHCSKIQGTVLAVGDKVAVTVVHVSSERNRITLELLK